LARNAAPKALSSTARWVGSWKRGEFEPPTTPSQWKLGQFFVLIYECMGSPPMCFNDYTMPAAFENPRDAVAYYRHLAIPRLLAILTDRPEDGPRDPAEGYLAAVDEERRPRIITLLAALDQALAAEAITDSDLKDLFDTFNEVFSLPPAESRVSAYGTIADILGGETYAEDLDQYADDTDHDSLGWIWASGTFDRADPKHFALAVDFIKGHPKL